MTKPGFTFAIPLRSAQVSRDWNRMTRLLEATIASALASRDAQVSVLVACHEIPDIRQKDDPRVAFVTTRHMIPASPPMQMFDKRHKKVLLVREHCRRGGGYMMLLDSDDLVSDRLAAHVLADDNRSGYLIRDGYTYDAGAAALERVQDFDDRCGSSSIFFLNPDDGDAEPFDWPLYIAVTRHRDLKKLSGSTPRPMSTVPFPAVMAITNNSENWSLQIAPPRAASLRSYVRRVLGRSGGTERLSPEIAGEFGFAVPTVPAATPASGTGTPRSPSP